MCIIIIFDSHTLIHLKIKIVNYILTTPIVDFPQKIDAFKRFLENCWLGFKMSNNVQ